VVEPCGIPGLERVGLVGRKERLGAVVGRALSPPLPAILLGFLFSLANLACLATREILCCFGDPEADPVPEATVDEVVNLTAGLG